MTGTRLIGIAVAGVALLGMSFASSGRLSVTESDDAIIRLSIAARPERIESCRTVSDEELAKLAPQMRQRVICEGTTARYQLELWHNGRLVGSQLLRGGGLRHDRRIYVLRDTRVVPGPSRVRVSIVRLDTVVAVAATDSLVVGDDAERARRQRGREAAIPAELHIDVAHDMAAREVLLVMYEPEQRRLVARTPATPGETP
jgi:hypothetical protein